VLRIGGHVAALVPEALMYEHGRWPSGNPEHQHAFTIGRGPHFATPLMALLMDERLLMFEVVRLERLEASFDFSAPSSLDQTCFGSGAAEAAIELVLRRR
jgi:hypothetical protein